MSCRLPTNTPAVQFAPIIHPGLLLTPPSPLPLLPPDNPYFRLAYNSLGAYGTINHLHFQAYYLAAPYAMERAPTAPLDAAWGLGPAGDALSAAASPHLGKARRRSSGGVRVEQLAEYPVRTLVFEAGDSLQEVSKQGGGGV